MKRKLLFTLSICLALFSTVNAQQTIPNGGFDTWTNYNPNSWVTTNVTMSILGNDTSAFKITSGPDHKSGAATMKLTTIKLNNNPFAPQLPDTVGVLFTGVINFVTGTLTTGFGYTGRPSDLSFYYRYVPMPNDTAFATIILQKWNAATSSRDTIATGVWATTVNTPNWTLQSVPLYYNPLFINAYPDTAAVLFSSSSYIAPKIGSALFLDDVAFMGWTGVDEMTQPEGVRVFPNPASSEVNFAVDMEGAATIEIFDVTGRKVDVARMTGHRAIVPVSFYKPGIYHYTVLDETGKALAHGKLSAMH
jgi:hypothetical protein